MYCKILHLHQESVNHHQVYILKILLSVHPVQTLQYQFFTCNDGESALDNINECGWLLMFVDIQTCMFEQIGMILSLHIMLYSLTCLRYLIEEVLSILNLSSK